MSEGLALSADWVGLDQGSAAERATFCELGIQVGDGVWLSEGRDALVNTIRRKPFLSAYFLAEWLTWNWWRLRWEPRNSKREDWLLVHNMSSIGQGYLWPNITIYGDDVRFVVSARPTKEDPRTPFRYLNDWDAVLPISTVEGELDRFIETVIERLNLEGVSNSNLHTLRKSLLAEKSDPGLAWYRKLEALMGSEPDDADEDLMAQLMSDREALGDGGIEELAAEKKPDSGILDAATLKEISKSAGVEQSLSSLPKVTTSDVLRKKAWVAGKNLAAEVRRALGVLEEPLSNAKLSQCAGVSDAVLQSRTPANAPFSFALDGAPMKSQIVLSSKWETGRRFAIARLLGDQLAYGGRDRLHAATHAYTYRQRLQRSFAAELLCPYQALEDMLGGYYSQEALEDAAAHFNVSTMTVQTMLANRGQISRDGLPDIDADADAA